MSGHVPAGLFVGVDVGASKVASGVVELPSGRVLASDSVATPALGGDRDHVDLVVRAATRMLHEAGERAVGGVGIGVCELVDREGRVRSAVSVELQGDRLRADLSASAATVIDSDVRAHALAEATLGSGRGVDDFAYVSAGTGVSSCLVIAGRPHPGARGNAIVLGSAPITVRCSSCGAETSEILEDVASGRAIAAAWGASRAEDVFEAAGAGDARAHEIVARAAVALGSSIAFLANVADPAAIVIGGGLAAAAGTFWGDVEREMRLRIWSEQTRQLPFLLSALGPNTGILGAALLPWAHGG